MQSYHYHRLELEEQEFLSCFSIFDNIEISVPTLFEFFLIEPNDEVSFFDMLHDLNSDGWIEYNKKSYSIPEKIMDLITIENPPSSETCIKVINFLSEKFNNTLREEIKTLDKYVPYIEKVLTNIQTYSTIVASLSNTYAIYLHLKGESELSKNYLKRAIAIQKQVNDKDPELCYYYNQLAIKYIDAGEHNKSLNYSFKSIRLAEEIPYINSFIKINSYNIISNAFDKLKKHKMALTYNLRAIDIVQENFDEEKVILSDLYYDAAISFFKTKDYKNANKYVELAISNYKENSPQIDEHLKELFTLQRIIRFFSKIRNFFKKNGKYFLISIGVLIIGLIMFYIIK